MFSTKNNLSNSHLPLTLEKQRRGERKSIFLLFFQRIIALLSCTYVLLPIHQTQFLSLVPKITEKICSKSKFLYLDFKDFYLMYIYVYVKRLITAFKKTPLSILILQIRERNRGKSAENSKR